jgi:Asp-tRNA(Asn)/Glu-tRNA(Gln) amidotransferase C subunit
MPPTPADVLRLARLAALALDEEDAARLAAELGGILAHIEVLAQASADAPEEAALPGKLRGDVRRLGSSLAFPPADLAPAWRDGYFVAPRPAGLDPGAPAGGAP